VQQVFAATKRRREDKVYGNDCYLKAADYVSNEDTMLMTHILRENEAAYQAYYIGCEIKTFGSRII
jgi:hypothetical protein